RFGVRGFFGGGRRRGRAFGGGRGSADRDPDFAEQFFQAGDAFFDTRDLVEGLFDFRRERDRAGACRPFAARRAARFAEFFLNFFRRRDRAGQQLEDILRRVDVDRELGPIAGGEVL